MGTTIHDRPVIITLDSDSTFDATFVLATVLSSDDLSQTLTRGFIEHRIHAILSSLNIVKQTLNIVVNSYYLFLNSYTIID